MKVWLGKIKESKALAVWRRLQVRCESVWRRLCAWCEPHAFVLTMLGIFVWRFALDGIYLKIIAPLWGYAGFVADVQPLRYFVSLLALTVCVPFVAELNRRSEPSSILLTLLNYLYFVPLTSYWGCSDSDWRFFAVALPYWALLLFWQFRLPMPVLKPLGQKHTRKGVWLLTAFAVVLVLYVSGRYTGFRLTFDIINVYDIRAEASGYNLPTIISYALSMMTVVLTFLILYWLRERKYWMVAALCVVYLFYFSIAALKGVFFLLLLSLAAWIFYRFWMLRALPWLLALTAIPAAAEYLILKEAMLVSLFYRRMMYDPIRLSDMYRCFFAERPLNLFRSGIMGKFSFDVVYSTDIAKLIGEFEGTGSSANNGLLGDLFANLPMVLGLVVLPLILVICWRLLDMAANKMPQKVLLPFCVMFANTFINTSWSTALLSHGFLLTCVVLYFYPKEEGRLS